MSLLMWECGLKLTIVIQILRTLRSLLMWECGLKPRGTTPPHRGGQVTPYVGVWIET